MDDRERYRWQQAALYGPGVHHGGRLPLLESDGELVWIGAT